MTDTEKMMELARRAVACPAWKWLDGMRDRAGCRVFEHDGRLWLVDQGTLIERVRGPEVECQELDAEALPDLSDPATLGCVLALVREAWGDVYAFAANHFDSGCALTIVHHSGSSWTHGAKSYAEALVCALEAAPAE